MGNTFGQLFRVTTFGESHGGGIGVVIDGCPPKIEISQADIQRELDRRRPGQSKITTQRQEEDRCEILSGVFEGKTLGTPIGILVRNKDARPQDYAEVAKKFRPSHADFTYEAKYGIRNWQGGGRASARETIGRVAAGVVAQRILRSFYPKIDIVAYVMQVHALAAKIDRSKVKTSDVGANIVRCPDQTAAKKMISLIEKTRAEGDSLGGVIECAVHNPPAGLGEPVFDKLEADLAKAMLSLPATKGFDYLHMNAASPIPESAGHTDRRFKPGNIIVSYRYINTLAVVDRDTKRIVWKTVGLTVGQHNPHFLPAGVPGTGHVLVFDNGFVDGNTNPYRISSRPFSRVLEINPVDNSITWEYTAENSNRPIWTFFSHYISGAQRQPNGNTLICEGSNGRIFEVTPAGEIVWEYVNPFPNLTGRIPNPTIFRAAKVPEVWLKR